MRRININSIEPEMNGVLQIDSIFEIPDGHVGVSALLQKCRQKNCTVHFANEDLTIHPGDDQSTALRATLTAYELISVYPKAAEDYFKYLCSLAHK